MNYSSSISRRVITSMIAASALMISGVAAADEVPNFDPDTIETDAALAVKLPESIKKAGVLAAGSDTAYAPWEYISEADGKTVIGIDVDLGEAIAKTLGVEVDFQTSAFDAILPALAAGADTVIAQGVEAGGHVHGQVSSLVLLPQVVRAVRVPVIGSGGFASGASLIAALALGAQGIHCGTSFVAAVGSFAHQMHKDRIVAASSQDTVHTDAFAINWPPQSPVRVLASPVTDRLGGKLWGHRAGEIPKEVVAEEEGRPIYLYSTDSPLRSMTGDLDRLAFFAGQAAGLIDGIKPAGDIVAAIVSDALAVLAKFEKAGT